MENYVALFRGINVGGSNVLLMQDLVTILEDIGARNVKTYIQSGNAVFQSEEADASLLSNTIGAEIEERLGFLPHVLLPGLEQIVEAVGSNLFPEAEFEPKTLHLPFLASAPNAPDLDALESFEADSERFLLKNSVFYLHAPDGIGRSRLVAKAEKLLGVPATARNWRTVHKVLTLAEQCNSGA